mmetsp:Transcript_110667/g.308347  ORF Transcript_110667/g.308347 Transcript_110667/m.308347 type:complete len:207 (-) Transcript_110667:2190-2810(-)
MPRTGHLNRESQEGAKATTEGALAFSSNCVFSCCEASKRCLTSANSPSSRKVSSLTSASCARLSSAVSAAWFISMFSTLLFHCTSFHSSEFVRTLRSSTELRSCCFRSSSSSDAEVAVDSVRLPSLLRWELPATKSCCLKSATVSLCCLSIAAIARLNSSTRPSAIRLASSAQKSCCRRPSTVGSFGSASDFGAATGPAGRSCCTT